LSVCGINFVSEFVAAVNVGFYEEDEQALFFFGLIRENSFEAGVNIASLLI
jgi:hypothetical protein